MIAGHALLAATVLVPLALAGLSVFPAFRRRVPHLLAVAPIPGLAAALLAPDGLLVLAPAPMRVTLYLDPPGAILLGAAAVLWIAAGRFAVRYMADDDDLCGFSVWWLLTLAGSLGVFVVGDIASFYLAFALVSLSAYGLASHLDTAPARRAGVVYLVLTLFGEAVLLMAFVMLAQESPQANPLIREAVAALPHAAGRDAIIALLVVGFGLKMGLVPLHVWMPLAHSVAPVPGSAVLSGIVVKAGVIGLIRFLSFEAAQPGWGAVLLVAGLVTAYYGIVVGLTQRHPKTVLAYSTVSQMGVVAAVLGGGLAAGDDRAPTIAAFYAANHILLKGGLFLAVGIVAATTRGRLWPVLAITAALGASLAGLPFTGGALAKLAVKDAVAGSAALLLTLSAAGTTLVMLRFLLLLRDHAAADPGAQASAGMLLPWVLLAAVALVSPFALYPAVAGDTLASAVSMSNLAKALWPAALGMMLGMALVRLRVRPPQVPSGDIVVLAERLGPALHRSGDIAGRLDRALLQGPAAALLLAGLVVAFAWAMVGSR